MRTLLLLPLLIVFLLLNHQLKAGTSDSLHTILQGKVSKEHKQQQIARLCYDRFLRSTSHDHIAEAMVDSLAKYKLSGQQELRKFIQILIFRRKFELEKADRLLTKSIGIAIQHSEKIFLYQFYLNQAYVQTDLGNALNAVYRYRLARRVAEELENSDLLMVTDIGISDIYMNIGLYQQALIYLDQAQAAYNENLSRPSTQTLIYLNKAETHFKMGQLDSLRHYANLANKIENVFPSIDRDLKRAQYFQLILEKKYDLAIPLIKELLATGNQYYKHADRSYLAKCCYHTGQLDLAFTTAKLLVQDPQLASPQIRLDAYKLLARIAQDKNETSEANHYLRLALEESEDYTLRMSKIGDLATALRLDRMEFGYLARNQIYKKERTILAMAVTVAVLVIIAIFVFYRNIKQKSRFEKLLHQARSEELAYINSHQVRKHLANILGICSLLDSQPATTDELRQYLKHVHQEAKEMDDRLKDVAQKLNNI